MPNAPRPYKTHLYPLTPIIYLLTALLVVGSMFMATFSPEASRIDKLQVPGFLALMAIGLVLYAIFRKLEDRNNALSR